MLLFYFSRNREPDAFASRSRWLGQAAGIALVQECEHPLKRFIGKGSMR